jgi:hypothetical protein
VAGHQLAGYLKDRFNIGTSFKAAAALELLALVPLLVSVRFVTQRPARTAVKSFNAVPPATTEEV